MMPKQTVPKPIIRQIWPRPAFRRSRARSYYSVLFPPLSAPVKIIDFRMESAHAPLEFSSSDRR
jgi:hypothetical protein